MNRLFALPLLCMCIGFMSNAQTASSAYKSVMTTEVYFDFGEHELRPDADSTLSAVKDFLEEKENLLINITAHTDSIGSLENNLALSERRSLSVKSALAEIGIPDSLLSISLFGETKPIASNNSDEGRQMNRRASIEILRMPPTALLEGYVKSQVTGKGLPATVVIRSKGLRDTLFTDSSGYYRKRVPLGIVVGVDAFAECHFFGTDMTKINRKNVTVNLNLDSAKTGETLALNNLYFVGGQPILLEKSKPELPKIKRFLEANPLMKIEIAGHVNVPNQPPVDEKTRHFRLSEDRAFVVFDFLRKNKIDEDRISFKGYGNWEMVYPRATLEKHQALNRRVEMRVLEGGCE